MLTYYIALAMVSSLVCGHALGSYRFTPDWFFKGAIITAALFAVVCLVLAHGEVRP